MASFVPRRVFPSLDSLPRSYFLGHHRAGLNKMKSMLSYIDLVIECRDYRVPFTSRNPLFEAELAGRQRLILYTKQDLGCAGGGTAAHQKEHREREALIRVIQAPTPVLFSDHKDKTSIRRVLRFAREHAASREDCVAGSRMMVVGMPNVGKSSLLNALRQLGVHKGKAAMTGAQPGVTRKIGTTVKIIEGQDGGHEDVYLADTPGVFIPYVPHAEAMLKLALCGSVKDTIIPPTTLADYLLYHLNLYDPEVYAEYSAPTNDIGNCLDAVAKKTGRLQKGGTPDLEAAALWMIQRWRTGHLGRFVLDDVSEEGMALEHRESQGLCSSLNQARRANKDMKRQKKSKRVLVNAA
ncbi:MAG: hypothetical protein Q9163_006122 [Psora crenata]